MLDCVQATGSAGELRGGVLVKGLALSDQLMMACANEIYSNWHKDVAKTGAGNFVSCTNTVTSFFASNNDAMYYFDESSGSVNLDCSDFGTWGLTNNTIDAAGKKFGIIVVGDTTDVKIENCTIKNAAMT